jgi:Ca2+-binding EF-hand superfamily protein
MIFKALDPDMPDDEVEQIISEVDEDGSGTVDYEGSLFDFFIPTISIHCLFK